MKTRRVALFAGTVEGQTNDDQGHVYLYEADDNWVSTGRLGEEQEVAVKTGCLPSNEGNQIAS